MKRWVRPRKPWTTKELAHLNPPICIIVNGKAVIDRRRRQIFAAEYFTRTGYRFDEADTMPLDVALQLSTGQYRPSSARQKAKEYFAHIYWPDLEKFFREFRELTRVEIWLPGDHSSPKRLIYCRPGKLRSISWQEAIDGDVAPLEPLRLITEQEAEELLQGFKDGLTSFQFIKLARLLATVKENLRIETGRKNRQKKAVKEAAKRRSPDRRKASGKKKLKISFGNK